VTETCLGVNDHVCAPINVPTEAAWKPLGSGRRGLSFGDAPSLRTHPVAAAPVRSLV